MAIIIRNTEQLFRQGILLATDLFHFRRPTATGPTKDYSIRASDLFGSGASGQASLDTSTSVISIDLSQSDNFSGSNNLSGNYIWSLSNTINEIKFVVFIDVSVIGTHTFNFSVKREKITGTDEWDSINKIWTPQQIGVYELRFDWSGNEWLLKINGAF